MTFINYFAQIIFNLLKLGRNQDSLSALFTEYLFTHQVSVYESIKKCLSNDSHDPSVYSRGFLLLIIKLSEKLCSKISSII